MLYVIAGLAIYALLVAFFLTLFIASSRRDRALAEHFARRGRYRNVG